MSVAIVDVVVPIYGIGPVLADTLISVLNQSKENLKIRCLAVVDGCPLQSTRDILDDLSAVYPEDLEVLYCRNSGVVGARNAAIQRLLTYSEPSTYTLFFDGDDILSENYIEVSVDELEKAPKNVGWVYADQFHFGDKRHWVRYPTIMWPSRFALNNLSQPSCLIRTEIIEKGARFDPLYNLGIEDWDFWSTAIGMGYSGIHTEKTFVYYRRLAGSRSSFNLSLIHI